MPNVNVPGAAYNYQATLPTDKELAWQPAIRVDYNVSERIRASFRVIRLAAEGEDDYRHAARV